MKQANLTMGNFGQIFKILSLFFLFTFTILIFNIPAAWAYTPHNDVFQVDISPTYDQDKTLFIVVGGNLLRSEDGGKSWHRIVNGLDNKHRLYSLDIYIQSKDTIFLSSLGDGIYKSQDGGSSWSKVNNGLENFNIDLLAISFHNPNLVLAAGQDRILYRTEDGGINWHPVLKNQRKITAIAFVADQKNLIFVGDEQGNIYFSEDRGTVWQSVLKIPREGAIKAIAVSPYFTKDQTLFVGTEKGSIFRSIDGGKSFAQIDDSNSHPGITSLVIAPQIEGNLPLFAVTEYDGVFYSDNSGRSWQKYTRGLTADPQAHKQKRPYFSELQISPAFPQDQTIFLAGYNGLFKSTNGGRRWQQINTFFAKTIVGFDLSPDYANDSTIAIGTYTWGSYLSSDRGARWQAANKGLEEVQRIKKQTGISRIFDIVFSPNYASDRTIFATTRYGLFKSTDRGKQWDSWHWQQIQPKDKLWWLPASQGSTIVASPNFAEDSTLYLGTMDGHIFKSTDGGKNFSFSDKLAHDVNFLAISPNFANDRTLYAGLPNQVCKSVDGGLNWQVASKGIVWLEGLDERIESPPVRLAISPNYKVDRTVFVGTAGGVFVTTDGGKNWQQLVNTGYGDDGYIEAIALSPNFASDGTLMVSVRGRGLFKSVDAGNSFTRIGRDLIDNNHLLSNMYGFSLVSASTPIKFSPAYSQDRTIYGYSESQLFQSSDGGNTWSAITIPMPDGNYWTFLYLRIKLSPFLTFVAALGIALLGYFLLGYLRLDKKLPRQTIPIKIGGTFAVFIIVFLALSS